jgi:tetratricopeptide (TPR) repeat protein
MSAPNNSRPAVNMYLLVFLGALVLRLAYLWQALNHNELLTHPLVDAEVYVTWSRDILAGQWLWRDVMHYTPAIPAWIAGWTYLLGWAPAVHFAFFLVVGAGQAVILGKTAELLWSRKVGIATGWLAALYWPLIIFEASYYAESFAIWNLALATYLFVRWVRLGGSVLWLAWAGFHLGWSILARANAMLCVPVLIALAMWTAYRAATERHVVRAIVAAAALALPPVLLAAPVLYWNYQIGGKPMMRTGGWLSVYLGNNPEYRGLVVPAGVRWFDFVYQPIRKEKITAEEQETFWRDEVCRVVTTRTPEWLALMGRKSLMLLGRFEISQEIDIYEFRNASPVLSLPIWPGWGMLLPLAALCAFGMWRSNDARRGWLLLILATAYFLSAAPVQACARYRLPTVVPLLPLAGWGIVYLLGVLQRRTSRDLAFAGTAFGAIALITAPDYLGLRSEKIVNHQFLVGTMHLANGNKAAAEEAFKRGHEWNPADPDCLYRLGNLALANGDTEHAAKFYRRCLAVFPACHAAVQGLGECSLNEGNPDGALVRVAEALKMAPNNQDALELAVRAYTAKEDWKSVAITCRQLRSYPTHPAGVAFAEARAWCLAGSPTEALVLYDLIAQSRWFHSIERTRALFLAATLAGRLKQPAAAALRWKLLADAPDDIFPALARVATGKMSAAASIAAMPTEVQTAVSSYMSYASATEALDRRDITSARDGLEEIVARRGASKLRESDREILEIWAIEDLRNLAGS